MSFFCMFRCKLMQHSLNNNPSGCVCHKFFFSAVKNQSAPVDIFLEMWHSALHADNIAACAFQQGLIYETQTSPGQERGCTDDSKTGRFWLFHFQNREFSGRFLNSVSGFLTFWGLTIYFCVFFVGEPPHQRFEPCIELVLGRFFAGCPSGLHGPARLPDLSHALYDCWQLSPWLSVHLADPGCFFGSWLPWCRKITEVDGWNGMLGTSDIFTFEIWSDDWSDAKC